jgi:hypothetical protein
VPGLDDLEAAGGQPLVEELGVGQRNDPVVAAVDDRYRRRYLPAAARRARAFANSIKAIEARNGGEGTRS